MFARRTLVALATASLCLLPTLASSAIVEKWHRTTGTNFVIAYLCDFNSDGVYKICTGEYAAGGAKFALRSATTGAILAQTAATYAINKFWIGDLDGDGTTELMFTDDNTFKIVCVNYTVGSSTLAVRWSYSPTSVGVGVVTDFVDFDGNGRLYLVFRDDNNPMLPLYKVYDRNGALYGTLSAPSPTTGASKSQYIDDFDNDGRQEYAVQYRVLSVGGYDWLYMFENNTVVAVDAANDPASVKLGASFPNPTSGDSRIEYSLPSPGPASLRMFDLSGREVRTLVDGKVDAGRHEAIWDGRDDEGHTLPAGAYFYELNAAGRRVAKRVIRLK